MALAIALVALLFVLVVAPWLLLLVDAPLWAPLAIDVTVLLSTLAFVVARWMLARGKAKKLEPAALQKPARDPLAADAAAELDEVRRDVDAAVATITRSRLGGGGRAALSALPWYVVLGPPGSGKSTLLRSSGLAFPSAPRDARRTDVPTGGRVLAGTRRVDLWLANEAVLLDTAGRWSVANDAGEWSVFLDCIAKHRGGRALDGALLTVPIDEIARATESERTTLARQLRARVEELVRCFGVAVPVYVVVTKCDRLVGFAESFASLDKRARARAWGVTIDRSEDRELDDLLRGELDELVRTVRARVAGTLANERRVEARSLAVELPAHLAAIIEPLTNLVVQIFVASVYGETAALRGVYFTSATQEGRPADRLLLPTLRSCGIDAPVLGESALEPRSYFVQQVLTRVAFADAETAAPRTRAKRRRTRTHALLGLSVALLAGLLTIASAFSWRGNRRSIDRLADALTALPTATTIAAPESLEPLRTTLVELRAQRESPPLSMRFGLLRTAELGEVAFARYVRTMRQHVLTPLLAQEATELDTWGAAYESDLDREPSESERGRALALLERQLRFGSPAEPREPTLDDRTTGPLAQSLAAGWCGALQRPIADCAPHATLLLRLTGADRPRVDRHEHAIRVARLGLGRASEDRAALDALVSAAAGRGFDLTLARMVGTTGRALATDQHVRGAFTRRGWEDVVRARLDASDGDADRAWLLGARAASDAAPTTRDGLRRLYFEAYADEWRAFLSSVRVGATSDATESLALLEDMTRGTPPPLGRLLAAVHDNARLETAAEVAPASTPTSTLLDTLTTRLGTRTAPSAIAAPVDTSSAVVASALAPYTHFAVRSDDGPDDAPLGVDVYRDELALLRDALATYRDDARTATALDARLIAARRRIDGLITEQAPGARDFFERVLRPPVEAAAVTSARAIASAVSVGFCSAVTTPFTHSIAGHYPFVAHGDDAPLGDVAAFYRPGGTLWSYYDASLASVAPRAGGRFTLARHDHDTSSAYSTQLPSFLERSQAITGGLFPPGGTEPRIELDVRIHPTAGAASVRWSVGGATIDYRNGPESWTRVVWPGATPSAGARLEVESARGLSERFGQDGEWGLFRLIESATQIDSRPGDRTHTARWHLPGHGVDVVVDIRTVRSESVLFDTNGRGRALAPLRVAGVAAPRRITRSGSECAP